MLSAIKKNYFYIALFPISYLYFLRDLILNKVEKTHVTFNKNIKLSSIKTKILN